MARPVVPRLRRGRPIALLIACSAAALGALSIRPPWPLLLWNSSPSSPVGLYAVGRGGAIRRGERVAAWPPPEAGALASARHYLPAGVPLVKSVAAVAGDRVCGSGALVLLDGRVAVVRRARDPSGRRLPGWSGCRRLRDGELLLLGSGPDSFDGRYFGISRAGDILGRASLIWPR